MDVRRAVDIAHHRKMAPLDLLHEVRGADGQVAGEVIGDLLVAVSRLEFGLAAPHHLLEEGPVQQGLAPEKRHFQGASGTELFQAGRDALERHLKAHLREAVLPVGRRPVETIDAAQVARLGEQQVSGHPVQTAGSGRRLNLGLVVALLIRGGVDENAMVPQHVNQVDVLGAGGRESFQGQPRRRRGQDAPDPLFASGHVQRAHVEGVDQQQFVGAPLQVDQILRHCKGAGRTHLVHVIFSLVRKTMAMA